jgi:hypothetical protein
MGLFANRDRNNRGMVADSSLYRGIARVQATGAVKILK